MRRLLVTAFLVGLTAFQGANAVWAAPAEQACLAGSVDQADLMGNYTQESIEATPRLIVTIYQCNEITISWFDRSGSHEARYRTIGRMDSGGLGAEGRVPDRLGAYFEQSNLIGVAPAEPGFIKFWTTGGTEIYRLKKA